MSLTFLLLYKTWLTNFDTLSLYVSISAIIPQSSMVKKAGSKILQVWINVK